jgi:hypothetical protein
VDQVKRAEPGSPSNGEMEFGITKIRQFSRHCLVFRSIMISRGPTNTRSGVGAHCKGRRIANTTPEMAVLRGKVEVLKGYVQAG